MLDITTIVWLIAGFGFLLVVGALLGAGTDASLTGLFPQNGSARLAPGRPGNGRPAVRRRTSRRAATRRAAYWRRAA